MPADFAFAGASNLPSSRNGDAAMAPILRTKRVVPPAPGKMPTMISGRPTFALGLSAQKMRCVASGSSSPIPTAVPGRTEATGLPPLLVFGSMPARSILRSSVWMLMMPSNRPVAGFSPASIFILASTFKSIPPAKLSALPEVMMMPFTASSASASSKCASKSMKPCWFITFMDLPTASHVIVAMPSASLIIVKSVIVISCLEAICSGRDHLDQRSSFQLPNSHSCLVLLCLL